jgi:tetrahydromethanopterin S-methyltransferase subunit G
MQLMSWTDERIEERFDGIDRRFDEAAEQTNRRFDEAEKRTNHQFDEVNKRLDRLNGRMMDLNRAGIGILLAMVGVMATLIANGG